MCVFIYNAHTMRSNDCGNYPSSWIFVNILSALKGSIPSIFLKLKQPVIYSYYYRDIIVFIIYIPRYNINVMHLRIPRLNLTLRQSAEL